MPAKRPPFPRKCNHCHGANVFMAKIDYDAKIKCRGYLHKFTVHNLEIPICRECEEKVFTEKVDKQIQEELRIHIVKIIMNATYEWRAAEVHAAACRLGIREDKMGCADDVELDKLTQLRILLDKYRSLLYP